MAITTKSDRKTEKIELAEVMLWVLGFAWTGQANAAMNMHEKPAKTALGEYFLFKFFNSLDLTNNIG